MLARSLKMAFWITYDHLGKLILASLIWSLPVALPGFLAAAALLSKDPTIQVVIGIPTLVLCLGVILPVVSAGLAHMTKELIDTRDGSITDMFRGIRLYWRRALGVGLVYVIGTTCLTTSTWFYAAKLRDTMPWLGYGISAVALWCLIFAALTSLLVMPTLVQRKGKVLETLKLASLLVLDNPVLSAGVAIQVLGLTAVALVFTPVLFFLYGSLLLVFVSSVYELLARKYATMEAGVAAGPDSSGRAQPVDDEEDDYLNRGFRDFLFPWKG